MDPACSFWKKNPGFRNQVHEETFPYLLLRTQDQRLGVEQDHFPGVHRNLFWQLSRDGNLNVSVMSHATTASWKPSLKASWMVGDAVVGRGNAGWTSSKSGHPCLCQNCSQWPPSEKTGRGSELNRPSCAPDDPIGQGNDLNWTMRTVIKDCPDESSFLF